MQDIHFTLGNKKISGAVFYPPINKEKYPTIFFVHGWTSEKERSYQYAKSLSELGYLCFLFDMRGHGKSEGDRTLLTNKDFLEDVVAAYDFLLGIKGVDRENLSAVGSSFGGYLVALLSAKRKLANLVLRTAADYPNKLFDTSKTLTSGNRTEIRTWRQQVKNSDETYALEAVHNFEGNVLIIESELDQQIPHQTTQNYINVIENKHRLTHVIIKDAPHSIKEGKFRDEVEKILINWFKTKK